MLPVDGGTTVRLALPEPKGLRQRWQGSLPAGSTGPSRDRIGGDASAPLGAAHVAPS